MTRTLILEAHRLAMHTKEATFRAQDALSAAWRSHAEEEARGDRSLKRDKLLRKLETRLARVRAELEQLDNEVLAAYPRPMTAAERECVRPRSIKAGG